MMMLKQKKPRSEILGRSFGFFTDAAAELLSLMATSGFYLIMTILSYILAYKKGGIFIGGYFLCIVFGFAIISVLISISAETVSLMLAYGASDRFAFMFSGIVVVLWGCTLYLSGISLNVEAFIR